MNKFRIVFIGNLYLFSTNFVLASEIELEGFSGQEIGENFFIVKPDDYGTNIGLSIGTNGILLVDPMAGESNHERLINAIRQISDKPIKFVLNTHADTDHSGSNEFFNDLGATQENSRYTVS